MPSLLLKTGVSSRSGRWSITPSAVLATAFWCLAGQAEVWAEQKLHVIAVGDTVERSDGNAATDVAADMSQNLTDLSHWLRKNSPEQSLKLFRLDGDKFSRQSIMETIDALDVTPDDTVMFYYCGHGSFDSTGRIQQGRVGTLLNPPTDRYQNLWMSEIREKVQTKHPRFFLTIADCCSIQPSKVSLRPYLGEIDIRPPREFSSQFNGLFMRPRGEIYIRSSAPGEYAIGCRRSRGKGSLFTQVFLDQLKESGRNTTWGEVIPAFRETVQREFDQLKSQIRQNSTLYEPVPLSLMQQRRQTVWAIKDNAMWFGYDAN